MDCPHCSTENLLGATTCVVCGKSMIQRPKFLDQAPAATATTVATPERPGRRSERGSKTGVESSNAGTPLWGAGPAETRSTSAPPASAAEALAQAICRICKETFDRTPEDTESSPTCPGCKVLSAQNQGADLGENQALVHPSTVDRDYDPELAQKILSGEMRPKLLGARRAGVRVGPVVAVVCLVLGLATLGVVKVAGRKEDKAAKLLGDVKSESAQIVVAPEQERVVKWDATLRLKAERDEMRSAFGNQSRQLDMNQVTLQTAEATLVREDGQGAVFDMTAECRVVEQTGKIGAEDAREAEVYPFRGFRQTQRIRAAAGRRTTSIEGTDLHPGRDIPFLFSVGDAGLSARTLTVGDKWKDDLRLTMLPDRQGRLFQITLPCDFVYAGRALRQGVPCAAVRVNAPAPQNVPPPLDESFNRREGEMAGAIFFELTTGLVVDATLEFEFRFWKDAGRVEDDLKSSGRYEIKRK